MCRFFFLIHSDGKEKGGNFNLWLMRRELDASKFPVLMCVCVSSLPCVDTCQGLKDLKDYLHVRMSSSCSPQAKQYLQASRKTYRGTRLTRVRRVGVAWKDYYASVEVESFPSIRDPSSVRPPNRTMSCSCCVSSETSGSLPRTCLADTRGCEPPFNCPQRLHVARY